MAGVIHFLRSGPSRNVCRIEIVNRTSRKVKVSWIDFEGHPRNYRTLQPLMHITISTYDGLPWICRDSVTMTQMVLNRHDIYSSSVVMEDEGAANNKKKRKVLPTLSSNSRLHLGPVQKKELILITLPMLPLWKLCAETVAKSVKSPDDIAALRIPERFQKMVISLLSQP